MTPQPATHVLSYGVVSERSIGTLGDFTEALAINDRAQVVGYSRTAALEFHAFLWHQGVMLDPGTLPGGVHSIALGINNRGEVVGQSEFDPVSGSAHAFLWKNGVMTDLGGLEPSGFGFSRAQGINRHGVVAGLATIDGNNHAARWTPSRRARHDDAR